MSQGSGITSSRSLEGFRGEYINVEKVKVVGGNECFRYKLEKVSRELKKAKEECKCAKEFAHTVMNENKRLRKELQVVENSYGIHIGKTQVILPDNLLDNSSITVDAEEYMRNSVMTAKEFMNNSI